MGLDKQNVYRGECTETGCNCKEYKRIGDGSRCFDCHHVAVKHVVRRTSATGTHKSTTNFLDNRLGDHNLEKCYQCWSHYSSKHGACVSCYPRDQCSNPKCAELVYYDKNLGSFNYCSRECRDECELKRANEELERALKEFEVVPGKDTSNRAPGGRNSDKRISSSVATSCVTQATNTTAGAHHPSCHTTNSRGTSLSFRHTASSTETHQPPPHTASGTRTHQPPPHTASGTETHQPPPHTVSSFETHQPPPHTASGTETHQPPPHTASGTETHQPPTGTFEASYKNSLGYISGFSVPTRIFQSLTVTFYDYMKAIDIHGYTGILVSAIALGGETCDLRLLDLVTHINGKPVKDIIGYENEVDRYRMITGNEVSLAVWREFNIPPMEMLKSFFIDASELKKYTSKLAAVSCTVQDLEDCATFLGIKLASEYDDKKITFVNKDSLGWNIGLRVHHIIVSVAMVTNNGPSIGPEPNWSFNYIKSTARENPGICALLLLLEK